MLINLDTEIDDSLGFNDFESDYESKPAADGIDVDPSFHEKTAEMTAFLSKEPFDAGFKTFNSRKMDVHNHNPLEYRTNIVNV